MHCSFPPLTFGQGGKLQHGGWCVVIAIFVIGSLYLAWFFWSRPRRFVFLGVCFLFVVFLLFLANFLLQHLCWR